MWKELVFGEDERTAAHASWISALSTQPQLLKHTKYVRGSWARYSNADF